MVLRLRGGGWGINVSINGKTLSLEGRDDNTLVNYIYEGIYKKYPFLRKVPFSLVYNGKHMEKNKTFGFYKLSYKDPNVTVVGVPDYVFGP